MPIVKIVKPFTFAAEDGRKLRYDIGEYDVDDETCDHWYFQAHMEGYQEPPPRQGTPQYAQWMLNTEQAVRNATPVAPSLQPPAPLAPEVIQVASRSGTVPEGAHYFAGQPQEDKPMPGQNESAPGVGFLAARPS